MVEKLRFYGFKKSMDKITNTIEMLTKSLNEKAFRIEETKSKARPILISMINTLKNDILRNKRKISKNIFANE